MRREREAHPFNSRLALEFDRDGPIGMLRRRAAMLGLVRALNRGGRGASGGGMCSSMCAGALACSFGFSMLCVCSHCGVWVARVLSWVAGGASAGVAGLLQILKFSGGRSTFCC